MGCCVLLIDGHGGGGCWLMAGDDVGFVDGLLAVLVGVGCWGSGIRGRWWCWCVGSCGGQLLIRCCRCGGVAVR